jgi:general stress protein 26
MSGPVTKVDARFSDPGASATTWPDTLKAIEAAELFWVTTVRQDGRPHVTPLVAVWHDDALNFCTGIDEQKAVNLRHNKQVVLTTGCNDWENGLDVVVEGQAEQITDSHALERLAKAWTVKWDGRWQYEVGDGCFHEHVYVFAVRPTRVLAFAKGGFSHTTHRFG